jgi:hypothetical protein
VPTRYWWRKLNNIHAIGFETFANSWSKSPHRGWEHDLSVLRKAAQNIRGSSVATQLWSVHLASTLSHARGDHPCSLSQANARLWLVTIEVYLLSDSPQDRLTYIEAARYQWQRALVQDIHDAAIMRTSRCYCLY